MKRIKGILFSLDFRRSPRHKAIKWENTSASISSSGQEAVSGAAQLVNNPNQYRRGGKQALPPFRPPSPCFHVYFGTAAAEQCAPWRDKGGKSNCGFGGEGSPFFLAARNSPTFITDLPTPKSCPGSITKFGQCHYSFCIRIICLL